MKTYVKPTFMYVDLTEEERFKHICKVVPVGNDKKKKRKNNS